MCERSDEINYRNWTVSVNRIMFASKRWIEMTVMFDNAVCINPAEDMVKGSQHFLRTSCLVMLGLRTALNGISLLSWYQLSFVSRRTDD